MKGVQFLYGLKLFETFNAGNMNLLFELSNTILPEMYSLKIDCGLGCAVCMLKPLVYVQKGQNIE